MKSLNKKNYISLILWVGLITLIGPIIGYLTKSGVNSWYSGLIRCGFTPPNYVFPIVWMMLYAMIGICGWLIWSSKSSQTQVIKTIYIIQLILNWSWSFLFFKYHMISLALISLLLMDLLSIMILYLSYKNMKSVFMLMMPYLVWILFASYLNFYIWLYN
jgi:benzodiazapine receptor